MRLASKTSDGSGSCKKLEISILWRLQGLLKNSLERAYSSETWSSLAFLSLLRFQYCATQRVARFSQSTLWAQRSISTRAKNLGALGAGFPNGFSRPATTRIGMSDSLKPIRKATSFTSSRAGSSSNRGQIRKSSRVIIRRSRERPPRVLVLVAAGRGRRPFCLLIKFGANAHATKQHLGRLRQRVDQNLYLPRITPYAAGRPPSQRIAEVSCAWFVPGMP